MSAPGNSSRQRLIVRALVPDDWRLLRALRLAALADAAAAFGSGLESAQRRTEAQWRNWPSNGVPFAAELAGEPVGVVGAVAPSTDPQTAHLIAMWVVPAARGTGVGDLLIEAVVGWARGKRRRSVLLEVFAGNEPAVGLYRRNGFLPSGEAVAVPGAIAMRRRVDQTVP